MSVGILGVFGLVMIVALVTIHNYFWELNRKLRKIREEAEREEREKRMGEISRKENEKALIEREAEREKLLTKYDGKYTVEAYREQSDIAYHDSTIGSPKSTYWKNFCREHSINPNLCIDIGGHKSLQAELKDLESRIKESFEAMKNSIPK